MTNAALGLQSLGKLDDGAVENSIIVIHSVHIVNHADVDVVGLHLLQQVVESGHYLRHFAGTQVLAVLPYGAKMALDDECLAPSFECRADVTSHVRV